MVCGIIVFIALALRAQQESHRSQDIHQILTSLGPAKDKSVIIDAWHTFLPCRLHTEVRALEERDVESQEQGPVRTIY